MKYSQEFVWECVGTIIPGLLKAKSSGCHINLPSSLKSCAAECWLIAEDTDFRLNLDKQVAAHVIRVALKELQEIGWMTFGDQNGF